MTKQSKRKLLRSDHQSFIDEVLDMLASLSVRDFDKGFPDPESRPGLEDVYAGFQLLKDDLKAYAEKIKKSQDALLNILEDINQKSMDLERMASFPEQNPSPIIETDVHGMIKYLNPAALEIFPDLAEAGYKHALLRHLKTDIVELEQEQKPFVIREVQIGKKVFQKHISLLEEEKNVRMFVFDITVKKRLDTLKEEFMVAVSHEMRTPLTVVKVAVDNLLEGAVGPLSEPQFKIIDIARNNCNRLARIINNVLDISRLESGKAKLNLQVHHPKQLLEDFVKNVERSEENNTLLLVTECTSDVPEFKADLDMLHQVLTNMISNAFRYARSRIIIRVQPLNEEIQFSVIDDGPGIPGEHRRTIFDKFEQVNRTSGSGYKGTGLGLAICKDIIEIHKGRIWVESEFGRGSAFHFTLPLSEEELKKSA